MKILVSLIILCGLAIAPLTAQTTAASIVILAGVASKPVLEEAADIFTSRTGNGVTLIYGGSGDMLSRIRLTGIGDVFMPASHDYMETAASFSLIDEDTCRTMAYLVPAIIVPPGNPAGITCLADLASPGVRIAFPRPESVALGLYAVEIIEKSGKSELFRQNIATYLENAAKVANAVALGTVDAAFGWREMVAWEPGKLEMIALAASEIPRVATIRAAVVKTSSQPEIAASFIEFLSSEEGGKIFARHGYMVSEAEVRQLAPDCRIGGSWELPESWK